MSERITVTGHGTPEVLGEPEVSTAQEISSGGSTRGIEEFGELRNIHFTIGAS